MNIKYQALSQTLSRSLQAVYVVVGSDPYLLNEAALQIKQAVRRQHEYEQTILDITSADDWSTLIAEANHYSLFSENVLLDARFEKKTMDANGKDGLMHYLEHPNERCIILLRAPLLTSKSLTFLNNHPRALVVQIYPLNEAAMKQWIDGQFKARNVPVDRQLIPIIYQYTQGNMLACAQLIEKLGLSLSPGDSVTMALLKANMTDQSHFELFDLADACISGNALKVLRLLQQFQQERVEPTLVLWILTQEIRLLLQLKQLVAQSIPFETACNQLKIWSSRTNGYAKALSRFPLSHLYERLQHCHQLDEHIKTNQTTTLWTQLDKLALSFC